jgi:hypothetical protein
VKQARLRQTLVGLKKKKDQKKSEGWWQKMTGLI